MEYVTAIEAARRIGVSEKTIRLWVQSGKLDALHPAKNRLAIAAPDVDRLARERKQFAGTPEPGAQAQSAAPEIALLHTRLADLEQEVRSLQEHYAALVIQSHQEAASTPGQGKAYGYEVETARRQKRSTATVLDVPAGAVHVTDFAQIHGVKPRTFSDHIRKGIKGEKVEALEFDKPGRPGEHERYLTQEQQHQARDFWKRHGVPFTEPGAQEERQALTSDVLFPE